MGNYIDTRWRYGVRYEIKAKQFADKVATVIVQALDGYIGDNIPQKTLAKLAELQVGPRHRVLR